jgi:hypothetical protein
MWWMEKGRTANDTVFSKYVPGCGAIVPEWHPTNGMTKTSEN